jgi:hypothetical protein
MQRFLKNALALYRPVNYCVPMKQDSDTKQKLLAVAMDDLGEQLRLRQRR